MSLIAAQTSSHFCMTQPEEDTHELYETGMRGIFIN